MPTLTVNQISIEYDSFGSGDAEPILLISGLGAQMIRWSAPFCMALVSRDCRVIRFDNRDAGLSTHLDDTPIDGRNGRTAGRQRVSAPHIVLDVDPVGQRKSGESANGARSDGLAHKQGSAQLAAIAATGDCRALLSKISVPTLVVHGSDDPLIPLEAGKDTAANIRGAELLVIGGMGHEIPPALYETVVAAIANNARRANRPGSLKTNDTAAVDPLEATR